MVLRLGFKALDQDIGVFRVGLQDLVFKLDLSEKEATA